MHTTLLETSLKWNFLGIYQIFVIFSVFLQQNEPFLYQTSTRIQNNNFDGHMNELTKQKCNNMECKIYSIFIVFYSVALVCFINAKLVLYDKID